MNELKEKTELELQNIMALERKAFRDIMVSPEEIQQISSELIILCKLRGEEPEDYNFEFWLNQWLNSGYSYKQIKEMIEVAKEMKKFGREKLAYGDIVGEWLSRSENIQSINWTEFMRILKLYEKKALKLLQQVTGNEHLKVSDYYRFQQYFEAQLSGLYKIREEAGNETV